MRGEAGNMVQGRLHAVLRHVRHLAAAPAANDADPELLRRFAQAHDEGAFAALVRRHGPLVLGVCRRILGNDHDAEDAFQAAFLVLARKAGALPWQPSVSGWLYQVATRVALRLRADNRRRRGWRRRWPGRRPVPTCPRRWSPPR